MQDVATVSSFLRALKDRRADTRRLESELAETTSMLQRVIAERDELQRQNVELRVKARNETR